MAWRLPCARPRALARQRQSRRRPSLRSLRGRRTPCIPMARGPCTISHYSPRVHTSVRSTAQMIVPHFSTVQGGSGCAALGTQPGRWSGGMPEDTPRRLGGQLAPGVAMALAPLVRGRREQGVCDAFTAMDPSALLRLFESDRSRRATPMQRPVLRASDGLCTRMAVPVTGAGK